MHNNTGIQPTTNPFTILKNLSPSYQPFTALFIAIHIYNSLPVTSLPFNFYRLHFPSMFFTFPTLDLKIRVLPLAVPIAPSGSLLQSVIAWSVQVRFGIESVRALNCVSVLPCSLFVYSWLYALNLNALLLIVGVCCKVQFSSLQFLAETRPIL